jgi:hypothetical protein
LILEDIKRSIANYIKLNYKESLKNFLKDFLRNGKSNMIISPKSKNEHEYDNILTIILLFKIDISEFNCIKGNFFILFNSILKFIEDHNIETRLMKDLIKDIFLINENSYKTKDELIISDQIVNSIFILIKNGDEYTMDIILYIIETFLEII